jgi:hypothetical protein
MKRLQSFVALIVISLLCLSHMPVLHAQVNVPVSYDILPSTMQIHVQNPSQLHIKTIHRAYGADALSIAPSQDGNRISLGSLPSFYQPQKPIVPMDTFQYPLRSNETIAYIKTVSMKVQKMPLMDIPLEIAQEPLPINELTSTLKAESDFLTSRNASEMKTKVVVAQEIQTVFPTDNVHFIVSGNSSNRYAQITCFPVFLYQGELYLVEKYTFEIGCTTRSYIASKKTSKKALILTPDEFEKEAEALQEIQEERGYVSSVVLLSSLQDYSPAEAPAYPSVSGFLDVSEAMRSRVSSYDYELAFKIRSYLKETLAAEGINYLTILGDATCVPPSYYILSPDRRNSYDQWVPTDIYYASPHAKGIEVPMEIAVGRLPVRDQQEAAAVVHKQKLYSQLVAKDSSWLSTATIMAGAPFGEHFLGELATSRSVNLDYFSSMEVEKLYRTENKFNKDEFMRVLDEGKRGFLWAFGHGSGEGLALEPGYANAKDLLSVPQKSYLPIVLSEACGNGAWDNRLASASFKNNTDYAYPTSFSEAVVLSEGAGIAYVGGARVNYAGWSLQYQNGIAQLKSIHYMDAILEYFMKGFSEGQGALGDWALKAMTYYADEQLMWGMNGANVKTYFGFTLQGDPTIEYPFQSVQTSSKTPEIIPVKTQPEDYRNWPLFSIDDGQELTIQSDESVLRVVKAEYSNMNAPFVEEMHMQSTEKGIHQKTFNELNKKTYALRFITPDQKEQRIVFHGRYNHDVVIQSSKVQTLMRPGEIRSQYAIVRNDGIFPVTDCDVVCIEDDNEIHRETYKHIPVLSKKIFYYNTEPNVVGEKEYRIETQNLKDESNRSDNSVQWTTQCTRESFLRIGVLTAESGTTSDYIKRALDLDALNDYFASQNETMEITQVPLQFYEDGSLSFETLGYDVIVLYTNNFSPTQPLQSCQAALERFTDHGGVVLGMLCLGQSNNGVNLQPIQSFFGIDPEDAFQMYRTSNTDTELVLQSEYETFSSSYKIQNRYTVLPKGRNWHQIRLSDSTDLVAIDEKGHAALTKNGNRWFYSGFLSQNDFKDQPTSLQFFFDLLCTIGDSSPNVALKAVSINPLVPVVGEEVHIVSTIVNTSSTIIDFGTIQMGQEYVEFQQLLPKEIRHVSLTTTNQEAGKHMEEIQISCAQDANKTDNTQNIVYMVEEKPLEPKKPMLIIDEVYEFSTCIELYGTVQPPEAVVKWNERTISCNQDGTFALVVDQAEGNHILLQPAIGEIEGDIVEVPLQWHQARSIEMQLHDNRAVANGKRITLQQPYQLLHQRSYLPLRDAIEALGGTISWDSSTNMVSIQMKQSELLFVPGEQDIVVNGQVKTLTHTPFVLDGTTMVNDELLGYLPELSFSVYSPSQVLQISSSMPIHQENPSVILHPHEDKQEDEDLHPLLGRTQHPMAIATCFDVYGGELYVSTPIGIYRIEDQSYSCLFEYPSSFYQQEPSFLSHSHMVNQMFFRMHKDFILLTFDNAIFVFDRHTSQLHTTIQSVSSDAFLEPIEHYSTIVDLEVAGDILYVLDVYQGFHLYDIASGELLSTYHIPSYLYSFEIMEDTIYACAYWGSIVTLHLDGSNLQEHELPLSYCYRLFMLDATRCLILSVRNPTKLYAYDLTKDLSKQEEEKDLQLELDLVEKMSLYGDQMIVLAYSYQPQKTTALQSGLFSFDKKLSPSSASQLMQKEAEEMEKDTSFVSHVQSIHPIPSSSYLAIEQGLPQSEQRIRLLDTETGDLKTLSTSSTNPGTDPIYARCWFQDSYSIVFLNQETREVWFRQFKITEEGRKQTIVSEKLQIQSSIYPDQLAVNENGFCVLDRYNQALYWFDFDGELTDTCRLESGDDTLQIPSSFDQFDINDQDQVLLLDSQRKGLFIYDVAGYLAFESLAFVGSSSRLDRAVYAENELLLLDRHLSSVVSISDHIVQSVYTFPLEDLSIGCFSQTTDFLIVYDEKTGQILMQRKEVSSPPKRLCEEDIIIVPDHLSFEILPNQIYSKGHFSVSIPTTYSDMKLDLPPGITAYQKRLRWGTDALPEKQNSFCIQFSMEGLAIFQEQGSLEIILEVDAVKKRIPIQVQTMYPKWEFLNGSPLFVLGDACFVGSLCSLVKEDMIWLSLHDLQLLFPMEYTIEENTITILTSAGEFVTGLDGSQTSFVSKKGPQENIEASFVQPVGDRHYLARADIIFQYLGAQITYQDSAKEIVSVEGWELVAS